MFPGRFAGQAESVGFCTCLYSSCLQTHIVDSIAKCNKHGPRNSCKIALGTLQNLAVSPMYLLSLSFAFPPLFLCFTVVYFLE
jgi:hypothetical protein